MSNRNKYRARKVEIDGLKFDSQKEANRWFDLKKLERAGKISDLRRQVKFPLYASSGRDIDPPIDHKRTPIKIRSAGYPNGRQASYVADFVYYTEDGKQVVEDVKGGRATDTATSRLKRAIVEAMLGIQVRIT